MIRADFRLGSWFRPLHHAPYVGASNVRDSSGLALDILFNLIQYHDDELIGLTLFLVKEAESRSGLLALDELITGDSSICARNLCAAKRIFGGWRSG